MKNYVENRLKHWYLPLVLGIVFIALGVWAFTTPITAFLAIIVFFSFGFIFSGIIEIIYSLSNRKTLKSWGWYLAGGIMTLLMGLLLAGSPDLTALLISFFIGFWLLFRSIMYTVSAFELKSLGVSNWGWTLVFGLLGIIFSFVLLWNPLILGLGLAIWIGFGLIVLGIINILLSFSLRKVKKFVSKINDFE